MNKQVIKNKNAKIVITATLLLLLTGCSPVTNEQVDLVESWIIDNTEVESLDNKLSESYVPRGEGDPVTYSTECTLEDGTNATVSIYPQYGGSDNLDLVRYYVVVNDDSYSTGRISVGKYSCELYTGTYDSWKYYKWFFKQKDKVNRFLNLGRKWHEQIKR